jgi:cell division protein FtsL
VAYAAEQKGRSSVAFYWLSFLTSFVIGLLVVIAIPKLEGQEPGLKQSLTGKVARTSAGQVVKCPYCAEWVKAEARVCKHCGKDSESALRAAIKDEEAAEKLAEQAQEREEKALQAKNREEQILREARWQTILRSKQLKALIALGATLVLVATVLLVHRGLTWLSFQGEVERLTSIPGSQTHVRETGERLLQSCGVPKSNYYFYGKKYETGGEFAWIELNPNGLSSEQIDCMSLGLVGLPYSFWDVWPKDHVTLDNGYFLGWLESESEHLQSAELYFGWFTR